MPSCVIRHCRNYSSQACKSKGITYHAFPTNAIRRNQWVNIVRRQRRDEDWMANNSSRICSVHFKNEDKYTSSKGLTLLKKTAVPVLEEKWRLTLRATNASPNSLDQENISDLESEFDTPRKAELEERIQKINLEKLKLLKVNKNLAKRNRRLEKKVANMKIVLRSLMRRITSLTKVQNVTNVPMSE